MSRMRLTTDAAGNVTIRYTDEMGYAMTREFFVGVSDGAGYVRERDADGRYPQVCERLSGSGSTITSTRDGLADTIRHEYRRMRAAERAEHHGRTP